MPTSANLRLARFGTMLFVDEGYNYKMLLGGQNISSRRGDMQNKAFEKTKRHEKISVLQISACLAARTLQFGQPSANFPIALSNGTIEAKDISPNNGQQRGGL